MLIQHGNVAMVLTALVATLFTSASATPADSIQVHLPLGLVQKVIDLDLPALEKNIDAVPLPTCCWDDVGVKHVHLNFMNMLISNTSISLTLNTSSTEDLWAAASVKFSVNGFYRLCLGIGVCFVKNVWS